MAADKGHRVPKLNEFCCMEIVCEVKNFLGNTKAANPAMLFSSNIEAFQKLGCLMSIKMYFLFSDMEKFPGNLGAMSHEQRERSHQDKRKMKDR